MSGNEQKNCEEPLVRPPYRKIIHIDMDAFFASVEQRDNPALRGKPVAVGGLNGRGVVATASYEARRFGVKSAMPTRLAQKLCPELILVPPRMARYKEVSSSVREIFSRYTDLVEPISIDEAFLDVTENKAGMALGVEVARAVKADIRRELSLTASAGVSYNKFLAKVASDWRKPDGLCSIHPDKAIEFIDTLKVEHLWGVGPATARRMHALGLFSAKDLRALTLPEITRYFGAAGVQYYHFVRGVDGRAVTPERERKSVGCEETFNANLVSEREVRGAVEALAKDLVRRCGARRFWGTLLTVKIRFSDFVTVSKSRSKSSPWVQEKEIADFAFLCAADAVRSGRAIRLLGLTESEAIHEDARQPDLFD